jgi:uncharacterized damage-inducible protein DinB
MLQAAIEKCPGDLWADPKDTNKFWHIAYHALFYTHLYLSPSQDEFSAWSKHREEYNSMEPLPQTRQAYSQAEILEYLQLVQEQVEKQIDLLDLDEESGFSWLEMNKTELLLYNLRHLQHHVGELCERLGSSAKIDVPWVGMKAGF